MGFAESSVGVWDFCCIWFVQLVSRVVTLWFGWIWLEFVVEDIFTLKAVQCPIRWPLEQLGVKGTSTYSNEHSDVYRWSGDKIENPLITKLLSSTQGHY